MKNIIVVLVLMMIVGTLSSCKDKASSEKTEEEAHEEHENINTTTLTSEQMSSIKVAFGSIEKKQLTSSLKANGILNVPNQNKATITALTGGIVKSILVQNGYTVKKGQVIATIANSSFIILQEDYLTTSSRLALSEIEYKRQKELQAGNATAVKTLQASENEVKTLKVRKSSLERQLELFGIDPENLTSENIQGVVNIKSPISGAISAVNVNIGTFVDLNSPIAEVIDNSQLHLDLFVYERDLGKLKENQIIHFTLTNNPGKEYDAKIYAISNTFEANTKTITVHATVEGDRVGLINLMNITALISLENATVDAVPTDAVVNYQGQDYIVIVTDQHNEKEHHSEDDGDTHDDHGHVHAEGKESGEKHEELTFERIPVRKGTTDVGYSEITLLKDIPHDSKIVSKGAFFIMAKMTSSGGGHEH